MNNRRFSNFAMTLLVVCSTLAIEPGRCANPALLKQMKEAEKSFNEKQDDSPAPDFDGWAKLMDLEKNAFVINDGQVRNLPAHVFKAPTAKGNFDLSSFVADDTIHVTEGMGYPVVKFNGTTNLTVDMAWLPSELSRFDVYMGEPGAMHQSGYRAATKLPVAGNQIILPNIVPHREFLLFAIIKPRNDQYFKFVFVLKPETSKPKGLVSGLLLKPIH